MKNTKTIKIVICIFAICHITYSQNKYDKVTTSQYSYSGTSDLSLPMMLKQKYDENQKYLNSLKSWILELRSQVSESSFRTLLVENYNHLVDIENGDLARLTKEIQNTEMKVKIIISDYKIFIKENNTQDKTQQNEKNYFKEGYESYKKNDFQESITSFSKALENDKNNTDILFYRALAKSALNDRYGAISDYDKIMELNSNYPMKNAKLSTVFNNKAYCLVGLKKYIDALPFIEKALDLDKSEWYIWDTSGELYYNLKNYDKCIMDMTKAILIKEDQNSYFYRGLSNIKLGKKDKGCKDLSKAGELGNKEAYSEISKKCN